MSAHEPVSDLLAALHTALNVAAVTTLAPGGVHNSLPQTPTYPCVRLWARAKPVGGIAGHRVWEADAEVWIYSTHPGDLEALAIASAIAGLLHYQPLAVTGWTAVLVALEDVFPAGDEEIAGVRAKTWVLAFRVHLDQAT